MDIEKSRDYKTIVQNMADIVMLLDGKGKIKRVNAAATHFLRYQEKELLGKPIEHLIYEDREQTLKKLLLSEKSLHNYEATFIDKDGRKIALVINVSIVSNQGDKEIILTGRDMKEISSLIQELKDSYRELEKTQEQLIRSEKLASAGRMAASVAHEIRNPLNVILMSAQLLNKKFKENLSQREYMNFMNLIIKNIERLNYLIEEFVSSARPPQLKMKLSNIGKILQEVISSTSKKCQDQRIKVMKNIEPHLPQIRVDREHIYQAFLNMALNGIEAMPGGGTLSISAESNEKFIKVGFADTGCGIPKDDMIRLFDPFFTSKKGGMGLGLFVCYGIISSHQGTIEVESKKGKTIFMVQLPFRGGRSNK